VSGLEVLTYAKADPITRMIPVVVLTSSRQDEDMVDSYCLGVNSYLQKPVDFEQFRRMAKDLGMYWIMANRMPSPSAVHEKAEVAATHK
jgi:two-component system, response regulator